MRNNYRAQLDAGLKALHDRQGQGSMPAMPADAQVAPVATSGAVPPQANAAALIQGAQRDADSSEANATKLALGN